MDWAVFKQNFFKYMQLDILEIAEKAGGIVPNKSEVSCLTW